MVLSMFVITAIIILTIYVHTSKMASGYDGGLSEYYQAQQDTHKEVNNVLKLKFYDWFNHSEIDDTKNVIKIDDYYVSVEVLDVEEVNIFYGKSSPLEVNMIVRAEKESHVGTLARSTFIDYKESQENPDKASTLNSPLGNKVSPLTSNEIISKINEYVVNRIYPRSHVTSVDRSILRLESTNESKDPVLIFFKSGEYIIIVPYTADSIMRHINRWLKRVPIEMENKLIIESLDEYLSEALSEES